MTYNTLAWCGGVMSMQGSFEVRNDRGVKYNLASTLRHEVIQGFAEAMGTGLSDTTARGKRTLRIEVSNNKLHGIMQKLWPYLTDDRKREYNEMLRKALEAGWEPGQRNSSHYRKAEKVEAMG